MNNDFISRSEAKKLGAICLARRNENGQLEAIISLDNAPTVKTYCYFCGQTEHGQTVERPQDDPMKIVAGKCPIEVGGNCPLKPQGEWIPVSERLPEEQINPLTNDFVEVLCTTIWGDVRVYKYGKPLGHDKPHFWYGCGIMDNEVIAWQPLPEPYKEEGETDG